jgi:hypothetical protein
MINILFVICINKRTEQIDYFPKPNVFSVDLFYFIENRYVFNGILHNSITI